MKERYLEAHQLNFSKKYPAAFKDGYYVPCKMPKVDTANGLTTYIINYLTWMGYRATRINVSGRQINGKWIPSSTRKGAADISATIRGKSVMMEIKCGRDKPSPEQLQEQERERQAGGIYEFIHTPDEFLQLYDTLVNL
jgi:hypothetical protein